jgi:hypothetical protein
MESTTLFWTARRYLKARDDELRSRYGRLPAGGREADGYYYTGEAKRIFPRYNVVAAILIEVERLDQDQLPDVDTVTETLLAAAEGAQSPFTKPPHDVIEARAMAEERRLFASNVQRWKGQPDLHPDPMPYRRVLAPDESRLRRAELHRRWGVENGCWHPLLSNSVPPDVLVLSGESMWADDGLIQVRRVARVRCRLFAGCRDLRPQVYRGRRALERPPSRLDRLRIP